MKTIAVEQSVSMIPNGASLMIGGFMGVGTPERIIDELEHVPPDLNLEDSLRAMEGRVYWH